MTATTATLTDFLLARIAEDEDGRARALRDLAEVMRNQGRAATANYLEGESAQVLAECEAKRRIVENCRADYEDHLTSGDDTGDLATETLMTLAAVYSDHPDYREDWV